jgi:hypothetical protein
MNAMRLFAITLILAAAPLHAQSPGEIAFWESVRDSRNPSELRAYLQQYPNGTFKALAEARLAAMGKAGAADRSVVAAAAPSTARPTAGDVWNYRLSYPRLRGQWGQTARPAATYMVTAGAVSALEITDQLSIDGGSPSDF